MEFNESPLISEDENLIEEVELRKQIRHFFLGDSIDIQDHAGEYLDSFICSNENALRSIDFNIIEVCAAILECCNESKIVLHSLSILKKILQFEIDIEIFNMNHYLCRPVFEIIVNSFDTAVISKCLRIFIIIVSEKKQNCFLDSASMERMGKFINFIQIESLDENLVARSWEMSYFYISIDENREIIQEFLINTLEVLFGIINHRNRVELIRYGVSCKLSGLTWSFRFLASIFLENYHSIISSIEFSSERFNNIYTYLHFWLHNDTKNLSLSSSESSALLEIIKKIFENTKCSPIFLNKLSLFYKDVARMEIFMCDLAFETIMSREETQLLDLLFVFDKLVDIEPSEGKIIYKKEREISIFNLIELVLLNSTSKWLVSVFEKCIKNEGLFGISFLNCFHEKVSRKIKEGNDFCFIPSGMRSELITFADKYMV